MSKQKIYLASDHAGFALKRIVINFLIKAGYQARDLGPFNYNPDDDYPDYALKVCQKVLKDRAKGILICRSGQGMDRVANKIPGIMAAVAWNEVSAKMAKEHSNVNLLCFGAKIVKPELAKKMVKLWLETPFLAEVRHVRRINKIKRIEKKYR